jgi:hypothetical protein
MSKSKNTIFIQIASYRDSQLTPTVKDCIEKADYPENLIFCIAWQHGPEENIDELKAMKNVKIIDIPHNTTKGTCWARNQIQQRYNGEKYTLQLDSHHRFAEHWDTLLIGMIKQLQKKGHNKPLLTGYMPSFNPFNDPAERLWKPQKMDFDRFIPEGAVFFLQSFIDNHESLTEPIPSRWYSAHFCFTLGQFCKEVPHDPNYLFHGEEISIAARAYTWGYDLFHPHKLIVWHEYTRKYRIKCWDEDPNWGRRNVECHLRNRKLFEMDGEKKDIDFGPYDFGKVRTLRDYEKYAGIHFKKRAIQEETLNNTIPPNNHKKYKTEEEWENSFLQIFKHCIDLPTSKFPENDYTFWCVAFERADGSSIYRKDVDFNEVERLLRDAKDPNGDKYIKLWRIFNTPEKPHHWVVWPYSKSKGWGEKIVGNL